MKALIKVGYGCNDHCTFCHSLDVRHLEGSAEEIHGKIERAKKLGHTMVVLSGGEPTIRPELTRWAEHVAGLDMDFGLVTNGRMLSYGGLVEQLLRHRLRYVYLSLHGGTARVHDLMVREEAFDQTFRALTNLSGRGVDLTANCVITKHNVDHLKDLVDATMPFEDLLLKFSMVEPKGGANHNFEHLVPRVSLVAERVREAIGHGRRRVEDNGGRGPRFAHGALPLCLMAGCEDLYDDLKSHGFWTMVEVGEPDFFPVDDENKVQPAEACAGCGRSGPCPGLYRVYDERFGSAELRTVTGAPRSNSFNYVYEARVTIPADEPFRCPLLGAWGVTPWDRGRHLMIRNGFRVARFRASSRDFSDAEMATLKHDHGQVYLDLSRKDAPDDFARDLRKLERSAVCLDCHERERCTGLFEPVEVDVFTRDDARIRELVAELDGAVLDVGCGDGPYAALLAPRVEAGNLSYLGLDPDADRIEGLRRRWPWAELRHGRAEDLNGADGRRFDHVLVLRSWNHIGVPREAVARMVATLRPGGTLTIVDNVAFGLARTRAQTERGEGSPASFEHYRNDDAAAAHAHVMAHGLELLERRDVGPATSNQWLLRYRMPVDGAT